MAVSLFWIGFPYLVMGFSHVYWMMLACVAMVGIGNNLWHPTAIPWLASRFPERKGLVMSFHSMGGNVGDAFAPLVVGALLAVFSWRDVVIINVVPGIVMSVLILFYIGRISNAERPARAAAKKPAVDPGERVASFAALLANRAVVMLSVGSAFRTMTQSALLTFMPVYLAATWAIRRSGSASACSCCRPLALPRRRSPAICRTPSAAARSSSPAWR